MLISDHGEGGRGDARRSRHRRAPWLPRWPRAPGGALRGSHLALWTESARFLRRHGRCVLPKDEGNVSQSSMSVTQRDRHLHLLHVEKERARVRARRHRVHERHVPLFPIRRGQSCLRHRGQSRPSVVIGLSADPSWLYRHRPHTYSRPLDTERGASDIVREFSRQ